MKDRKKILSENLERLLVFKGLTKSELARKMKIKSPQSLNPYFIAESYPRSKNLNKLCKALGVSIGDLTQPPAENVNTEDRLREIIRQECAVLKDKLRIIEMQLDKLIDRTPDPGDIVRRIPLKKDEKKKSRF